jgi:hypothetical protein
MIWITRARPVIDRIACPWLIVKRIDPDAQFLFVAEDAVLPLAAATGGVSFDTHGARYTHDGARCTFDALIAAHGLDDDVALLALADIVRAADTDRLPECPQAAGLLAASLGLRRVHARDQALVEAGFGLYDALYAWCATERGTRHGWTPRAPA